MDLSDIDQWSRTLLQNEARKRGIRDPETYSKGELVRAILRHDYASARGVREAARVVGGFWGSAKFALRTGLGLAEARLERGLAQTAVRNVEGDSHRELARPVVARSEVPSTAPEFQPAASVPTFTHAARADVPAAISPWDEPEPAAPSAPRTTDEVRDVPTASTPLQPAAADPADFEQLSYGPHPDAGLMLRWRVGADAIHRARAVLGAHGELALRVIAVRVEDGLHVRTETLDHGPVDSTGDWTAPLAPSAARYVSSVGLRSGERFVSIVHAAS